MGQEEEGHEHGHLVPDAARRQLAQRNRLPVELREPVPREGDVLRQVLPVDLPMEVRRELSDGLFAQRIQLELDFRFPAGLVEGVHQLHERDGPASFPTDRFRERGRRARQDDLVVVEVRGIPEHVEIPAAHVGLGLRGHRVEQDLVALHLQDGPCQEDELAGGHEVHGAVFLDLVQEEFRERHEVDLPRVEAPLECEFERRDHGLLERVPDRHVHPLIDLVQHREVAIDSLAALRLADQRLVEEQVVEDRLVVLAHAGITSVGFSSSTSARFTRMMTSDNDSGVIVTPTRWSASFRLTLRREIWTNCAVALFRRIIRATFSALMASRFWSISSSRQNGDGSYSWIAKIRAIEARDRSPPDSASSRRAFLWAGLTFRRSPASNGFSGFSRASSASPPSVSSA